MACYFRCHPRRCHPRSGNLVSASAMYYAGRFENSYSVFYTYDVPTIPFAEPIGTLIGQKMDEHWYRYYVDSWVIAEAAMGP
jgi:hypothetical protein